MCEKNLDRICSEKLKKSLLKTDCQNQRVKKLPCSLWLTGHVHEEECDESFLVFCLVTKNCARFLIENGKKESD